MRITKDSATGLRDRTLALRIEQQVEQFVPLAALDLFARLLVRHGVQSGEHFHRRYCLRRIGMLIEHGRNHSDRRARRRLRRDRESSLVVDHKKVPFARRATRESMNAQSMAGASITNTSASVIIGISGLMNDLRAMNRQTRTG